MDIRHKQDKTRVIAGVTLDINKQFYFKAVADTVTQYPVRFWEPADKDSWSPVFVEVTDMGKSITYRGSHVGVILNTNDFRFALDGNTLKVEMRS